MGNIDERLFIISAKPQLVVGSHHHIPSAVSSRYPGDPVLLQYKTEKRWHSCRRGRFDLLGIEVSKGLVAFYRSSKHQDETITRTVRKLENLLSTLENLELASQKRRFRPDEVKQLHNVEESVESCRGVIAELQTELDKFGNSTEKGIQAVAKRAGRKLAYPFRESTLKKLDEDISEFRSNLLVALNVLQLKRVDDIQNDTADLAVLVNLLRTTQISDAIRDWLRAPDATSNHNEACKRRHSRTGLWLVNGPTFQKWLEEDHSFLWLNGHPGSGKTILSSTAIQYTLRHRRSNPRIGIAFYYFSFSDKSKQDVSGLLRALLLQLSSQLDDGHAALARLHNTYRNSEPPVLPLQDTLKQVIRQFEDVYIIADALDEAPRGERRDAVLGSLSEMCGWSIHGLHILVTSRDETDIRSQLASYLTAEIRMDNTGVDDDIADYIVQRLRSDHKFKKWAPYHTEIQETLIGRAQGVFRWVDCQFTTLASCPSSYYHLKKALNSLPRSLDETYSRMLMNIDPELKEEAKRILTWLCFAKRPVTVQEIIDGLMIELGENPRLDSERRLQDANDVIWICPGLISLNAMEDWASPESEPESEPDSEPDSEPESEEDLPDVEQTDHPSLVRIAHFSVQEYLESQRIKSQTASVFALDGLTANTELAKTCLVYLINVQTTDLKRFPLASYAAKYWYRHLRDGDEKSESLSSLATNFFSSQDGVFEDWIRIFDPYTGISNELKRSSDDIASLLFYASFLGLHQPLQKLLEDGSIRSAINRGGDRALRVASEYGYDRIVQLLLDHGAEVNASGGVYGTALRVASRAGHLPTVKLLLDHGAGLDVEKMTKANGSTLRVLFASQTGSQEWVQWILDSDIDIDRDVLQEEAVRRHGSVSFWSGEEMRPVLDRGADVTNDVLAIAYDPSHYKVVQLLLDEGAEATSEALEWAPKSHLKVIESLLDKGAQVTFIAIQAALEEGRAKVLGLLLDKRAKIDIIAIGESDRDGISRGSLGGGNTPSGPRR
ncbi:hypothetical protein EPUS_05890 [Endocarpon pusillum Z07020]|uniref:NACHT domain-containing protein n=1 Tax=Endocarpon pusillum (strain Z07020 / HMAS-L-300199) TaxID=1263415 RepID=U1GNK6_ENDPU|nr:uncharacterized protein EPUS_05890 [Endocarpon pusillum Z07020]ERF73878.1 hypothetical protein EPUS_05890 [Endocarpon pusillum Z07020]